MNQKDKQLSLADLCTRFHYGVKVMRYIVRNKKIEQLTPVQDFNLKLLELYISEQEFIIKPYLRSMSSMTEDEKKEYYTFQYKFTLQTYEYQELNKETFSEYLDWLNKNNFDYLSLIEKGLALNEREGMKKKKRI